MMHRLSWMDVIIEGLFVFFQLLIGCAHIAFMLIVMWILIQAIQVMLVLMPLMFLIPLFMIFL